MKSILSFLTFIVVLVLMLSGLYFWRTSQVEPKRTAPDRASSEARISPPTSASPARSQPSTNFADPSSTAVTGNFGMMARLDQEFQALVRQAKPSVVSITIWPQGAGPSPVQAAMRQYYDSMLLPAQHGSGVIVSKEGYIVTNFHVVRMGGPIEVELSDGRSVGAKIIGADPLTDIAVLKINAGNLQPMLFGDSDLVRPGQIVFAVGNPFGLQETVTQGIISGIGRRSSSEAVNEFFQTDTAVNPGNSGGPLIDLQGEMIGINNAIHTNTGSWQGISFAIPSNTVKRVYENIRDYGHVVRTWFGLVSVPLDAQGARELGLPNARGALVHFTVENSPAEKGGIQAGDVIVEFNGKPIGDFIDLRNRIAETQPGDRVPLRAIRKGRPINLEVQMETHPKGGVRR